MKKIIIAIDGYSSTGKSTVAKQLAESLGYTYVDTGAMYRAVTYYAVKNNFISENHFNKENFLQALSKIKIEFRKINSENRNQIFLNDFNVSNDIRNLKVSNFVSKIAAIPQVRKKLVAQQQKLGKSKGIVMDGRDIGTVVFPQAELKIFMTAPAKVRAERRYLELRKNEEDVNFEDVLENIESRDYIDTTRTDSPLQKAKDAIEIDNSNMNVEEQFHCLLKLAEDRISTMENF